MADGSGPIAWPVSSSMCAIHRLSDPTAFSTPTPPGAWPSQHTGPMHGLCSHMNASASASKVVLDATLYSINVLNAPHVHGAGCMTGACARTPWPGACQSSSQMQPGWRHARKSKSMPDCTQPAVRWAATMFLSSSNSRPGILCTRTHGRTSPCLLTLTSILLTLIFLRIAAVGPLPSVAHTCSSSLSASTVTREADSLIVAAPDTD